MEKEYVNSARDEAHKAQVEVQKAKAEFDDRVEAIEIQLERLRNNTGNGNALSGSSGITTVRKKTPPKGF